MRKVSGSLYRDKNGIKLQTTKKEKKMKAFKLKQSEKEKYLKVIYKAWYGLDEFRFKKYNDLPTYLLFSAGISSWSNYDWSSLRDSDDLAIRRMYILCLSSLHHSKNNKKKITRKGKRPVASKGKR